MTAEGTKPVYEDASAADALREFVALARADGPSQADLDRLASGLQASIDGVGALEASQAEATLGSPPPDVASSSVTQARPRTGFAQLLGSPYTKVVAAIALAIALGFRFAPRREPLPTPVPAVPALPTAPERATSPNPQPVEPQPLAPTADPVQEVTIDEEALAAARAVAPPASTPRTLPSARAQVTPELAREQPSAASELVLIAQAEAARGEPARALSLLTQHERLYPQGALVQEREVLAIEALLGAGERQRAHTRADRFERSFPGSAHQPRVRALLARTAE